MSNTSDNSPAVFRGGAKLATHQEVELLKEWIKNILIGDKPNATLGENGYIPWKYKSNGKLDLDYLFSDLLEEIENNSGTSILLNGIEIGSNVKAINFNGNYVSLSIDDDNNLVCTIDKPDENGLSLNMAKVIFGETVKEGGTIPSITNTGFINIFGEATANSKQLYVNSNPDSSFNYFDFTFADKVYADTLSSTVEVIIYDAQNNEVESFYSTPVVQNTEDGQYLGKASGGNNIFVSISDFDTKSSGCVFKPAIKINLAGVFGNTATAFKVKVINRTLSKQNTIILPLIVYNAAMLPTAHSYSINLENKPNDSILYKWCSGIKYADNAVLKININNVSNLNKFIISDEKIYVESDDISCENIECMSDNYNTAINNVSNWTVKFKLNNINVSKNIVIKVYFKNAFGQSNPLIINVPISLFDSSFETSTNLKETFASESYRVKHNFEKIGSGNQLVQWDSTLPIINSYDNNKALMVIPNVGVKYPSGNYISYIPIGSPDYSLNQYLTNEKYFCREFIGNDQVKFGGIFKIKGLTLSNFKDQRLNMIISHDNGNTWFDLKTVRNMKSNTVINDSNVSITGVMTNVYEEADSLVIHWAYPKQICSSNRLYFRLGLKNSNILVRSIQLFSIEESEEW